MPSSIHQCSALSAQVLIASLAVNRIQIQDVLVPNFHILLLQLSLQLICFSDFSVFSDFPPPTTSTSSARGVEGEADLVVEANLVVSTVTATESIVVNEEAIEVVERVRS